MAKKNNVLKGKVCGKCGRWKPLSEYYNEFNKGESQGQKQNRCKDCSNKN